MAPVIDLGGNHPFMKKYPDPYNIRINASGIRHVLRGEVPQPVRDRRRGRRPGTRPAGMGPVAVGRPQGELQVLQLRALHQRQGGEARRGVRGGLPDRRHRQEGTRLSGEGSERCVGISRIKHENRTNGGAAVSYRVTTIFLLN